MSITFPTPPLMKIMRAWKFIGGAPGSINSPALRTTPTPAPEGTSLGQTEWLKTTGGRVAEDRARAQNIQTVSEAQTILDAHSDTT
jgi:hypothetical protein